MRLISPLLIAVLIPVWASAETVIAARTIRPKTVLAAPDISSLSATIPGAISDAALVIGREARVVLYAGRPIRPGDIGPPALVTRNQLVRLRYRTGGLSILAEGRALARGGVGDRVRVMNTASKRTVSGIVDADGTVSVVANGQTREKQP